MVEFPPTSGVPKSLIVELRTGTHSEQGYEVGLEETIFEYWSIHVFKFARASVAVGAGRVGVVVVFDGSVVSNGEASLLVAVDVSAGWDDLRPASWETRTPIATAARITKTRARPH